MTREAAARPAQPDTAAIIDPPDPRLNEVLKEIMHVDASRLENFLGEARDKAGQLRAIIKLPAREPQAFREKLVLILELIRGIHARAQRLPLPSVCDRAERFEAALGKLRDKQTLSGNDFLPLAVKLDDLLSHLAIQGEVVTRLRDWRAQNGGNDTPGIDATQRSATATGTTIRQPQLRKAGAAGTSSASPSATQKTARLSDLSQESLEEMATFLADMYSKRVSLVVVGLEDVPRGYRRPVEKILGQLIHNAIRHGVETPADRVVQDKPEIGTVAVQFTRAGADGYQLSVQDDGRGLDHDKIRAEAVRQGVLTAERRRDHRPAQTRELHLPPRLHHRRRRRRARHRHGRGARSREQGRRKCRHRDQAGRIHALPHHAAAREKGLRRRRGLTILLNARVCVLSGARADPAFVVRRKKIEEEKGDDHHRGPEARFESFIGGDRRQRAGAAGRTAEDGQTAHGASVSTAEPELVADVCIEVLAFRQRPAHLGIDFLGNVVIPIAPPGDELQLQPVSHRVVVIGANDARGHIQATCRKRRRSRPHRIAGSS